MKRNNILINFSYYCFIFILKYYFKEIAAPLIKFFNFAAPQNYKKIKSVCKYNSKFVPFMQN
jgi:hypothetical protein